MHRVRLLRGGVPVAEPDHHAPPADRAAPRDGAPARRARRCAPRCASSTTTTGSRRAPPTARARPPVRWRSTPATLVKELRRREHGPRRRSARRCNVARRLRPAPSAPPASGLRAGAAELAPSARELSMPPPAPASCPAPSARARPPSTCPRASTGSSDARRRTGRPDAARGAGGGLGARRPAAVDSARRRRPLLRHPVELEGVRRRAWPRWRGGPRRRCAAGPATASCRS